MQVFRQGDFHLGIAEKAVVPAQQVDSLAGSLGEGFLETSGGVLVRQVGQAEGVGGGGEEQGSKNGHQGSHVNSSEWRPASGAGRGIVSQAVWGRC